VTNPSIATFESAQSPAQQAPIGGVEWKAAEPLPAAILRRACDPKDLPFATTDELPELPGLIGQQRAVDAIRLGIAMRRRGFNVFAFGPGGAGKHTLIQELLERQAGTVRFDVVEKQEDLNVVLK
jgi:hypothetical protein